MKKRTLIKWIVGILLTGCVGFILLGLYDGLRIQQYDVDAAKIEKHIRIVLIADLHSCRYGENESELIDAIRAQSPDLILLAGDIFDDVLPDENTARLLAELAAYPCYYVTGNHEYWSGNDAFEEKMRILESCGVVRLSAVMETFAVHGEIVNICGVDDPEAARIASTDERQDTPRFEEQITKVRALADNGYYTILLSHRPEYMDLYAQAGFDLVLSGHTHGGQWRIPGLLNGLYAPPQGWFPKYAGGRYTAGDTTMIVSRGLARESTRVPRFYNRPEIVVIDLH